MEIEQAMGAMRWCDEGGKCLTSSKGEGECEGGLDHSVTWTSHEQEANKYGMYVRDTHLRSKACQ